MIRVALIVLALGLIAPWPTPAQAEDRTLVRVIVDFDDVVMRGGHAYYRYGGYRDADRLGVARDRYGRPVYYRIVYRDHDRDDRYGNRYRHRDRSPWVYDDPRRVDTARRVKCNSAGNCTVTYYDPSYDRRAHGSRYGAPDPHGGRHWRGDDDR